MLWESRLACHSHKANKREVIEELGRCLRLGTETHLDQSDNLRMLFDVRAQLNAYVRELHVVRRPLGMSAYQVNGEVARLSGLTSRSRCTIPHVMERGADYLRKMTDLLARLPDCRSVIENRHSHPWRGCRSTVYSLTLRDDVENHLGRLASGFLTVRQASGVLHEEGLCGSNVTRGEWLTVTEVVRRVMACPHVPAHWFEADPRQIAKAYVRLDWVTQRQRQLRATLAEFTPDAIAAADAGQLKELVVILEAHCPSYVPRQEDTARTLTQRLQEVAEALAELQRRAAATAEALRCVVKLLQGPFPAFAVKVLRRFADLADQMAHMPVVRRSWWNADRRQELQKVILRCQEEIHAAQELRIGLMARLSPQAFAAESAPLAAMGSRFRFVLARLLPRWWSYKAKVAGWYTQEVPTTAAMLEDLQKLTSYHRRLDYCRQVQAEYAAEFVPGADGQPDPSATLQGLDSVNRLEQAVKVPLSLQALLSTENALDRDSLAAAAAVLAKEVATLRQQLDVMQRVYDMREVQEMSSPQIRCTAHDLDAWATAQLALVDRQRASLEKVNSLLRDGQDLPIAKLPAKLKMLLEAVDLRAEVAGLRDQLGLCEDSRQLEDFDWSQLRARAEGTARLSRNMGAPAYVSGRARTDS